MTRELPILFSAPMVRAILDGRKTMTRRVVTPQPSDSTMQWLTDAEDRKAGGWQWLLEQQMTRWRPDDTLWVREAWRTSPAYNRAPPRDIPRDAPVEYLIDPGGVLTGRYRHPRFMPRWFSRVTLRVTDVRIERLQDISEADAVAEGMIWQEPTAEDHQWWKDRCAEFGDDPEADPIQGVWLAPGTRRGFGLTKEERSQPVWGPTAIFAFQKTWSAIHGHDAWDANPWVSVTSFKRVAE